MTSNVAQNYPYGSETEAERAAAVERADGQLRRARAIGSRPRVHAARRATRRRPLVGLGLPQDDFTGRLHAAGHARERHAVYTVCDTCGRTFLR